MTNPIRQLTVLVGLLAAVTAASAQSGFKLITVDLARAYDSYWETQEKNQQFADIAKKAEEELTKHQNERSQMVDEARALQEKANSEILSQDARDQAAAELQQKGAAIRQKEEQMQQFAANTERVLQQRRQTHQELVLDKITGIVLTIGKERGADLILDTSGPTGIGVSNVLWADESTEITDLVIAKLNEDKPEDFDLTAPSSSTPAVPAPATTPTPATTPAPIPAPAPSP